MGTASRPLAVVTGASSGIGLELAKQCAQHGFDLLMAADDPTIKPAARLLEAHGAQAEALEVNLSEMEGVEALHAAIAGRPVAALLANACVGSGSAFLDESFDDILRVLDTNVTGTLYLMHKVGRHFRARGAGRILLTGSFAGSMPATQQAVYNGTKAMLSSFSCALRAELKGSGVTLTCLMPGATETELCERAELGDTKVVPTDMPLDAEVAKVGFEAMMRGDGDVVAAWGNKRRAVANVTSNGVLAEPHLERAAPGDASRG